MPEATTGVHRKEGQNGPVKVEDLTETCLRKMRSLSDQIRRGEFPAPNGDIPDVVREFKTELAKQAEATTRKKKVARGLANGDSDRA